MSDHSQEMPKTWPELERRFARAIACAGAGPLGQPEAGGAIQLTGKTPREAIYALGGEVIDGPVAMFPAADSLDAAEAQIATLVEALETAAGIIDQNPSEDYCRHGAYVHGCDGEDGEPCIDRSRRELIAGVLSDLSTANLRGEG